MMSSTKVFVWFDLISRENKIPWALVCILTSFICFVLLYNIFHFLQNQYSLYCWIYSLVIQNTLIKISFRWCIMIKETKKKKKKARLFSRILSTPRLLLLVSLYQCVYSRSKMKFKLACLVWMSVLELCLMIFADQFPKLVNPQEAFTIGSAWLS